jgi:hypothetical protein
MSDKISSEPQWFVDFLKRLEQKVIDNFNVINRVLNRLEHLEARIEKLEGG